MPITELSSTPASFQTPASPRESVSPDLRDLSSRAEKAADLLNADPLQIPNASPGRLAKKIDVLPAADAYVDDVSDDESDVGDEEFFECSPGDEDEEVSCNPGEKTSEQPASPSSPQIVVVDQDVNEIEHEEAAPSDPSSSNAVVPSPQKRTWADTARTVGYYGKKLLKSKAFWVTALGVAALATWPVAVAAEGIAAPLGFMASTTPLMCPATAVATSGSSLALYTGTTAAGTALVTKAATFGLAEAAVITGGSTLTLLGLAKNGVQPPPKPSNPFDGALVREDFFRFGPRPTLEQQKFLDAMAGADAEDVADDEDVIDLDAVPDDDAAAGLDAHVDVPDADDHVVNADVPPPHVDAAPVDPDAAAPLNVAPQPAADPTTLPTAPAVVDARDPFNGTPATPPPQNRTILEPPPVQPTSPYVRPGPFDKPAPPRTSSASATGSSASSGVSGALATNTTGDIPVVPAPIPHVPQPPAGAADEPVDDDIEVLDAGDAPRPHHPPFPDVDAPVDDGAPDPDAQIDVPAGHVDLPDPDAHVDDHVAHADANPMPAAVDPDAPGPRVHADPIPDAAPDAHVVGDAAPYVPAANVPLAPYVPAANVPLAARTGFVAAPGPTGTRSAAAPMRAARSRDDSSLPPARSGFVSSPGPTVRSGASPMPDAATGPRPAPPSEGWMPSAGTLFGLGAVALTAAALAYPKTRKPIVDALGKAVPNRLKTRLTSSKFDNQEYTRVISCKNGEFEVKYDFTKGLNKNDPDLLAMDLLVKATLEDLPNAGINVRAGDRYFLSPRSSGYKVDREFSSKKEQAEFENNGGKTSVVRTFSASETSSPEGSQKAYEIGKLSETLLNIGSKQPIDVKALRDIAKTYHADSSRSPKLPPPLPQPVSSINRMTAA